MKPRSVFGKAFVFLALASFAVPLVRAQSQTLVSGTVTDPNGVNYASAKITAQLQPAGAASPCVIVSGNCVPISGTAGPATLDSTGTFSMNVYPNASILCGGKTCTTTWLFSVTISPGVLPPWGTGPQSFSASETVSGSTQNISSDLNAVAPALTSGITPAGGCSIAGIAPTSVLFINSSNKCAGNAASFSWNNTNSVLDIPSGGLVASFFGDVQIPNPLTTVDVINLNLTSSIGWYDQGLSRRAFLGSTTLIDLQWSNPFAGSPFNIAMFSQAAGTPTPGHLVVIGSGDAVIADGGPVPTQAPAIQSTVRTTLATNISPSGSTPTTVVSHTVTMPTSGCPCRVNAQYTVYLATNNWTGTAWVTDGTNIFASGQTTGVGTNTTAISASEVSQTTYANNATPTFTLTFEMNGTGGTINAAAAQGSATHTFLTLTVLTSN